jgi:hypothetical protein
MTGYPRNLDLGWSRRLAADRPSSVQRWRNAAPVIVVNEHNHWSGYRPDLIENLS